ITSAGGTVRRNTTGGAPTAPKSRTVSHSRRCPMSCTTSVVIPDCPAIACTSRTCRATVSVNPSAHTATLASAGCSPAAAATRPVDVGGRGAADGGVLWIRRVDGQTLMPAAEEFLQGGHAHSGLHGGGEIGVVMLDQAIELFQADHDIGP